MKSAHSTTRLRSMPLVLTQIASLRTTSLDTTQPNRDRTKFVLKDLSRKAQVALFRGGEDEAPAVGSRHPRRRGCSGSPSLA